MNQLVMLDELGTALDPPEPGPSARVRQRLDAALVARERRVSVPRLRRPVGLSGWRLAGAATLAVVLTAVGLVAPVVDLGGHRPTAANAADILRSAADAAEHSADLRPRPDQFVFVETVGRMPSAAARP